MCYKVFENKTDIILHLLEDDNKEVNIYACVAASTSQDEKLCPKLIEKLVIPGVSSVAYSALIAQKKHLIRYLEKNWQHYEIIIQNYLINILGEMQDPAAPVMLMKCLQNLVVEY